MDNLLALMGLLVALAGVGTTFVIRCRLGRKVDPSYPPGKQRPNTQSAAATNAPPATFASWEQALQTALRAQVASANRLDAIDERLVHIRGSLDVFKQQLDDREAFIHTLTRRFRDEAYNDLAKRLIRLHERIGDLCVRLKDESAARRDLAFLQESVLEILQDSGVTAIPIATGTDIRKLPAGSFEVVSTIPATAAHPPHAVVVIRKQGFLTRTADGRDRIVQTAQLVVSAC